MSDDEDCDELPMITVNNSANESGTFAMPSAEELATQRERELACEDELARLRERADADERQAAAPPAPPGAGRRAPPGAAPAALARSDSSGSEGDAALAAAVRELQVRPRAPPAPRAAALCAALAARLPPPARPARPVLALLQAAPAPAVAAHLDDVVSTIASSLAGERDAWPDEDMLCTCALLAVCALAVEARRRRSAARLLHALLDDTATLEQVSTLAQLLATSFPEARTQLQLGDVLRSGAGAGADRLAAALTGTALLRLMEPSDTHVVVENVSIERLSRAAAAWRAQSPAARYCGVQLAGRVLAAAPALPAPAPALPAPAPPLPAAALLHHLAPPAAAGTAAQRQDRLKVLVGASKLRLLFRTEQ